MTYPFKGNRFDERIPFETFFPNALLFETMMNNSEDSIYFKNKKLQFIYVNRNKARRHGIQNPEEMYGRTDFDFLEEEIAETLAKNEREILGNGVAVTGIIEKLNRIDGKITWASSSKYPLCDHQGKVIGIWGISRDITESECAKEALNHSEARHKALIANISDVIVVADPQGVIAYVSPSCIHSFGWKSSDLIGTNFLGIIHPKDRGKWASQSRCKPPLISARKATELRYRCADGRYKYVELTCKDCLDDPHILGMLINFRDISQRKKREKKIIYLSHHDMLTGLYNRTYFNEALCRLDAPGYLPLTLMMGDMNGLKAINDSFGHAEGDRLLVETARIFRKYCRRSDVLARLGGDEFYLLLPRTTLEAAQELSNAIRAGCAERRYLTADGYRSVTPSISLGYAVKLSMKEDLHEIMRRAEFMMYRQKHTLNPIGCRPY
jgi:diguanylate cyclase (GGDEF)-like protein/PAS domain S-box-containing protein